MLHAKTLGRLAWLTAAAVLGLTLAQCGRGERFSGANLILISLDTLRADRLEPYGGTRVKTPALNAFAADAVLFERAFAQYPVTLPSHATVFTGLLPPAHGVRENGSLLGADMDTLAERLSAAGYRTAGFVSSFVLRQQTGIAQGFDVYDDDMGGPGGDVAAERDGPQTVARALDWLGQNRDGQPLFLFLHLYDPHAPYDAPEPYASQYDHPYDAEVAHTDAIVGAFLDGLKTRGLYDDAVIALFADHGEGLGDHGEKGHGVFIYTEAIHTPLIVKLPRGKRGGQRLDWPVGLMDLKPTLEALVGLPASPGDGMALFSSQPPPAHRPIYSESYIPRISYGWSPLRSAVQRQFHYIEAPRPELYDLVVDPGERQNLLPGQQPPATLTGFLEAIQEGSVSRAELSAEDIALLESLGYVGQSGTAGAGADDRDPKDHIHLVGRLEQAAILRDQGDLAAAESELAAILNEHPYMATARFSLAKVFQSQGRHADLERLYEDGLVLDPANVQLMSPLVAAKLELGKIDEAVKLARVVHANDRGPANDELGYLLDYHGQTQLAFDLAQATLDRGGDFGYSSFVVGQRFAGLDNCAAAIPLLERAAAQFAARRLAPFQTAAEFQRADCLRRSGAAAEAILAYRRVLSLRPEHQESRIALTLLLAAGGRRTDAIRVMDDWVREFPEARHYQIAADTMRRLGYDDAAAFYAREAEARADR